MAFHGVRLSLSCPICAAFIFGGSLLEFVVVTMLMSPFAPLDAFVMALMVQSRHLFYGISMLEKYGNMGVEETVSHVLDVR
ncbi:MAG: AzlC family ABC transporter permease [Dialister invisus]